VEAAVLPDQVAQASDDDGLVVVAQRPVPAITAIVERAYAAHYRDVYRYVLALTRSAADADEVTAEVFERALRSWRAEPERVEAWLLLTARRLATDRWRRARRLLAILPRLTASGRTDAGEAQTEFWTWFDALSRVLTDRQREVLVLRYHRDLTDADIAVVLGISESGVRSLVARALDALRAHPELL
jgi:RNA polymerase sigma-70 factor (ECF subfamily)